MKPATRWKSIIQWANKIWDDLKGTWQKSRFEKGRSVNGRDYVLKLSDVKDHLPDRRKGLDYMLAPFQRLDLPGWRVKLNERLESYANIHSVEVKGLKGKQKNLDYSIWRPANASVVNSSVNFGYPMWTR